jgi:hypothetical protein
MNYLRFVDGYSVARDQWKSFPRHHVVWLRETMLDEGTVPIHSPLFPVVESHYRLRLVTVAFGKFFGLFKAVGSVQTS